MLPFLFVALTALQAPQAGEGEARPIPIQATAAAATRTDLATALADACEQFRQQQGIVGLAVAVLRDGEVVFDRGFGHADQETGNPVTPDTLFRLASISKPITATLAMRLVEQQKLELDAPIGDRLRTLPEPLARVTLRQLLSHTGGVRHYRAGAKDNGTEHYTTSEAVALFASDPLIAEPGTRHSYSTHAFTLVAAVLEQATGVDFVTLLRAEIQSQGLPALDCEVAKEAKTKRSMVYTKDRQGRVTESRPREDLSWKYAGGGMESTARELARFGHAVLTGRLVTPASRDLMWTPVRLGDGSATTYGLGWGIADQGARVQHTGSQQGSSTVLTVLPQQRIVIAILANTTNGAAPQLSPILQRLVLDAAPRATDVTDLGSLLEPLRAQHDLPALGGAILTSAGLVALGVTGERARGSGVPVQRDDRWHLGSCTKAMTATLAAILVQRGTLPWDATVGGTFGATPLHDDWKPVRLDWLLQNRGGAPANAPPELWRQLWNSDQPIHEARAWFVGELLRRAPAEVPGTKFVYSNQGFNIAGVMLETTSGRTWEEMMQRELFAPLGMTSAGFGPPGSADDIDQPRGHKPKPIAPGKGADNPAAIGPAGTVHASLADWAKFVQLHLHGARGGPTPLLQPEAFARLHTPPEGQTYAMGWGTAQRPWAGGRVLTHTGSNTMNFCVVWIAPERDHAFLAVTNIAGDGAQQGTDAAIGAMIQRRGLRR